jgi:DinB superfamily
MDPKTLLDPRYLELDPAPIDVPDAIRDGRAAIHEIGRILRGIPDSDIGRPWTWSGESEEEVRTGAYLALAAFHEGAGETLRTVQSAGLTPGPAGGALAAVSRARWDLHGILESLDDETYDADPGGGEWSIRDTLGHVVTSQRAYPWFSPWWLARRDQPLPDAADESHGDPLPSEEAEASGSPPVVLQRLDSLIDLAVALWSPADADTLAVRARWAGFPVTLGFRTHRWGAHLEEHTLQVDKTLAMLGTSIAETHRLHRLLCRAWGDVEAVVFALPTHEASRAAADEVAGGSIRVATEGALALVRDAANAAGANAAG